MQGNDELRARLRASLLETGRLRVELEEARRRGGPPAPPYAAPPPAPAAATTSADRRLRAAHFQLLMEKREHEAVVRSLLEEGAALRGSLASECARADQLERGRAVAAAAAHGLREHLHELQCLQMARQESSAGAQLLRGALRCLESLAAALAPHEDTAGVLPTAWRRQGHDARGARADALLASDPPLLSSSLPCMAATKQMRP
jgi:hypothetical protein